jgi:hypothetical protein
VKLKRDLYGGERQMTHVISPADEYGSGDPSAQFEMLSNEEC